MQNESLQDDEIHHSVGKVNFDPCPRESNFQIPLLGNISPPIYISPPITISPPSKQHILEQCQLEQERRRTGMLGLFHKVLSKLHLHESNKIVVYNYIYQGFSIQAYNNYNEMKNYNPVFNIYNRGNNNSFNYYDNSTSQKEEAEAEYVNFEEVKPKTKEEHFEVSSKDYSNSPLVPLLTYPEHAQYFISWLHLNMDNQKDYREKLKAFRAVSENGYFKRAVPYDIFVEEFGYQLSQGWYSTLMGENGNYSDDELKLAIQTLDKERFSQNNLQNQ